MNLNEYVGIPWVDQGRTRKGCDCWGLLWLIYRERLGIELPSYSDRYVTAADRAAIDALIKGELGCWREIPRGQEQSFDGVLMNDGGKLSHIGVTVRPGKVLHVRRGSVALIEDYRSFLFGRQIAGFFRHEAQAHSGRGDPAAL